MIIDLETVPEFQNFNLAPTNIQNLWAEKTQYQRKDKESPADYYEKAGIMAEFGKIICISIGIFSQEKETYGIRLKSLYGDQEKKILTDLIEILEHNKRIKLLCAHNGKEFDFPFLCRRMIINGIKIPKLLNIAGKKPWEVPHLDTMELWKFGDYKHYTSLNLLATILGIDTPKDDITGAEVRKVYYELGDLSRIANYCQKDVLTTAQILLKFSGIAKITAENITIVK